MFCTITTQFSKIILALNIMSYIDLTSSTYSNLQEMAIYAQGVLTATTPGTDPIEVYGGFWAGNPVTEIPSGSLAGISGEQTNPTFLSACASQLNTLVEAIYARVTNPSVTLINSGDVLFYPGYYYDGGSGIDYPDSTTLTFDAKGDPNAQFILWSDYHFTFPNTTFVLINGARSGNVFFAATSTSGYITITNSTLVTTMTIPCIIIATTITVISTGTSTQPLSVEGAIFSRKISPSLGGNTNLTDDNTSAIAFSVNRTFAEYIGVISPTYVDLSTTSPSLSQFAILGLVSLTTASSTDTTIIVKDGYWYGGSVSSNPDLVPEGILSGYNDGPAINPTTYTAEFDTLTALINSPIVTVDYPSNPITNTTTSFYPNFYYSDDPVGSGITYDNLTTLIFDAKNINNAQFFINAVSLIFNGTSFNLINGATAGNIFWISSDVSVSNSLVPGIIMSQYGLVDISLTDTTPTILSGHIFSKQDVSVSYINNNTPSTLTIQAAPLSTIPPPPAFIDVNITCPHSMQFTIFTQGPFITSSSNNTPIIIEDGYWYAPTNTSDPALTYIGDLSGYNDDPVIHLSIYVNEITALINEINSVTAGRTQTITNTDTVFLAGILYEDDGSGLNYSDITITFNAKNDTTSQFFIGAGFFTFTNVTFDLINGATAGNIFWLSGGNVSFATNLIPGIIIAGGTVSGVDMVSDVSTVMNGHIYSHQGVSFTYTNTNPSSTFTVASQPISTNPAYPPVNVIDFSVSYPNLLEFAVLAIGKLATLSPALIPIVIKDGYWYGNPVTTTPDDSLVGEGTLSGFNPNPATSDIYTNQLNDLIAEIVLVTNGYLLLVDNTTITFYPEYLYQEQDGTTGLAYDGVTLSFDAKGNPDAQFFLNASFFTFNNVSFDYVDGAKPSNIFWLADNYIESNNSLIPGIIMALGAGGGIEVVFTDTPPTPTIMNCHMFSKSVINLNTSATTEQLTIQSDPIPPIYIDLQVTCPRLLQFAVTSLNGSLIARAPTNTPTIISHGYWFGNPVDSIPDLVGEGLLKGYNNDPVKHPLLYQIELQALVAEILAITTDNIQPFDDTVTTFYPEILYRSTGIGGVIYDTTELTFDAKGDPKAQFFINAVLLTINGTLFNLINGAQASNIFWWVGTIDVTNSIFPGIILSGVGVNITLDNNEPMTLNGHIFSLGNVDLYSNPDSDAQLTIISNPVSNKPPYPPFPTIDLNKTYPNLVQFSVISRDKLYTSSPTDNTRPIVIDNGYWFGNPVQSLHPIISNGTYSGYNDGPAINPDLYSNELTVLRAEIFVITLGLRLPLNSDNTFYPQYLYVNYDTVTPIPNPLPIDFADIELEFDAGGDPDAQFFIHGLTITFTGTTFSLINGAQPGNIFWVSDGYVGITNSSVPGIIISRGETSGDGVEVIYNDPTTPMTLRGHIFSRSYIDLVSEAPALLLNTNRASMLGEPLVLTLIAEPSYIPPPVPPKPPVVCYAKGTLILTKNGYVPIENMKAGDKVITNGKIYKNKNVKLEKIKTEPVVWVGKFKVNKLNSSSRPICITKNSLANNFPFQNLYVSPNHSIIIDGEMVLAKDLVNKITIYQDNECEDVEYYHLECENHSTVIANGIVSESYLNMDNRSVFENNLKIHRKIHKKPEIKKILLL